MTEEEVGLGGTADMMVQNGNCVSSRSALGLDGSSEEKQKEPQGNRSCFELSELSALERGVHTQLSTFVFHITIMAS